MPPRRPLIPYDGESKLLASGKFSVVRSIHGLLFLSRFVTFQCRRWHLRGSGKITASKRIWFQTCSRSRWDKNAEPRMSKVFGDDVRNSLRQTCIRDYIHIIDLAHAHILSARGSGRSLLQSRPGGGSSVARSVASCPQITWSAYSIYWKNPGCRAIRAAPDRVNPKKIKRGTWLAPSNSQTLDALS